MAQYLQTKPWDEIRKLTFEELIRQPCCEIGGDNGNAAPHGTFLMNPTNMHIQHICDMRGMVSNNFWTPEPEKPPLYVSDKPPKPRRKRKVKG